MSPDTLITEKVLAKKTELFILLLRKSMKMNRGLKTSLENGV